MATFVIAHGAWSAGWAWKRMRPLMRARGRELFTPTYTGIGERTHLAKPDVDLSTHVACDDPRGRPHKTSSFATWPVEEELRLTTHVGP